MYERIKESFAKQGLMQTLNARLLEVEKGLVKITCSFSQGLTQQHGFFHAGVLTSIVDSACGYAALTLMPLDKEVLSVEFKINFLKPANTMASLQRERYCNRAKTLLFVKGMFTMRPKPNCLQK